MSPIADEEKQMYLYLKEAITRCGNDDLQFFQTSFYWCYDRHHDCVVDLGQYRLHAIIPQYVVKYVKHLQEKV